MPTSPSTNSAVRRDDARVPILPASASFRSALFPLSTINQRPSTTPVRGQWSLPPSPAFCTFPPCYQLSTKDYQLPRPRPSPVFVCFVYFVVNPPPRPSSFKLPCFVQQWHAPVPKCLSSDPLNHTRSALPVAKPTLHPSFFFFRGRPPQQSPANPA
jgi:hypothetical protein